MNNTKKMRKVIWAIDPFESKKETCEAIIEFFKLFSEKYDAHIEPVYVFSPESLNLPLQIPKAWNKQYEPQLKKALMYAIQGSKDSKAGKVPSIMEPRIVRHSSRSLRASIQTLLSYAKASGADLIVTGTHGRSGLDRLLIGSFAETLLLQSKLPVLVVHPGWKAKPIDKILFPTDFEKSSKNILKRVLEIARAWDAELIIHHAVERPVEPVFQSGLYLMGGGWFPLEELMTAAYERGTRLLAEYKKLAEKAGVKARTILDSSGISITDSIQETATKEGASLIAIQARSGAAKSAILGSISRQVIRNASSLVWVLRQ
jgi:nucleotide-binding universal stress UspA family protein